MIGSSQIGSIIFGFILLDTPAQIMCHRFRSIAWFKLKFQSQRPNHITYDYLSGFANLLVEFKEAIRKEDFGKTAKHSSFQTKLSDNTSP